MTNETANAKAAVAAAQEIMESTIKLLSNHTSNLNQNSYSYDECNSLCNSSIF